MAQGACKLCELAKGLAERDGGDLHNMLGFAYQYLLAQFGVDAVDVLIYEGQPPTLKAPGGEGFRIHSFATCVAHSQLIGSVTRGQKTVHIPDLSKTEWGRTREFAMEGFVTYVGVPLFSGPQIKGVLELFHRKPLNVNSAWLGRLNEVAEYLAPALARVIDVRELRQMNADLSGVCDAVALQWALSLELRGIEPKGHAQRVAELTVDLARMLGATEDQVIHIRRGALLHDIGKAGIPDQILFKAASLEEGEWDVVRLHPLTAYSLMDAIPALHLARSIPWCHHEKWDGTGYPRGLKGEAIPVEARIFALVDTWDMLRSDVPYRKAWPDAKILAHIRTRGTFQFDPELAETFAKLIESGKALKRKAGTNEEERRDYFLTKVKT